jgi:transcription-repair coupling factor (superfamily II helicase)
MLGLRDLYTKLENNIETHFLIRLLTPNTDVVRVLLYMFLSLVFKEKRPTCVIVSSEKRLLSWYKFVSYLSSWSKDIEVYLCPASHFVVQNFQSFSQKKQAQRIAALLQEKPTNKSKIIITTLASCLQKTFQKDKLQKNSLELYLNKEYNLSALCSDLDKLGYLQTILCPNEGEYKTIGSILQVFPVGEKSFWELDFFGDSLFSIKNSSDNKLNKIKISAVHEFITVEKSISQAKIKKILQASKLDPVSINGFIDSITNGAKTQKSWQVLPFVKDKLVASFSLFDNNTPIFLSESLKSLTSEYSTILSLMQKEHLNLISEGQISFPAQLYYANIDDFKDFSKKTFFIECFQNRETKQESDLLDLQLSSHNHIQEKLIQNIKTKDFSWQQKLLSLLGDDYKVVLCCKNSEQMNSLSIVLETWKINNSYIYFDIFNLRFIDSHVYLAKAAIDSVLVDELEKIIFLSSSLIIKDRRVDSKDKLKHTDTLEQFKKNQLVVHKKHGVGKFLGLFNVSFAKNKYEVLKLEYLNKEYMYLPSCDLPLLSSISQKIANNKEQKLDKLGGSTWKQKIKKASKKIHDIAEKLLAAQAKRKTTVAQPCIDTGHIYDEYVNSFPYEETNDQLKCIDEVTADLKRTYPMDRILIGDVGFGKTEVAIRAALKVILSGKQVLFMVPTTILCNQHKKVLSDKLDPFAIRVEALSRQVSSKEKKNIYSAFINGTIDILVGTHSLLNEKLANNNVGLIIVDEEQRFGVLQKEKIQKHCYGAHLLTLSATPIPRTLHQATMGLKDISYLTKPLPARRAVKIYVEEISLTIIKEAVYREIMRDGQIFYVCNNLSSFEKIKLNILKIFPDLKIAMIHGQMSSKLVSEQMQKFLRQEYNLLVCSTIIENGIDMPNVNTIIVQDSQYLGLSQLHQLKGRVGRGTSQAYAYFLTKDSFKLCSQAKAKMQDLATFEKLGSGLHLSYCDMEHRGAGDLLGSEQSGQLSAIGYETYMSLLEAKIKEIKKEHYRAPLDPEINLDLHAFIDANLVADELERLRTYRNLFRAIDIAEVEKISAEFKTKLSTLPKELDNLIQVAKLRVWLCALNVKKINYNFNLHCYEISFYYDSSEFFSRLKEYINHNKQCFLWTKTNTLLVSPKIKGGKNLSSQEIEYLSGRLRSIVIETAS